MSSLLRWSPLQATNETITLRKMCTHNACHGWGYTWWDYIYMCMECTHGIAFQPPWQHSERYTLQKIEWYGYYTCGGNYGIVTMETMNIQWTKCSTPPSAKDVLQETAFHIEYIEVHACSCSTYIRTDVSLRQRPFECQESLGMGTALVSSRTLSLICNGSRRWQWPLLPPHTWLTRSSSRLRGGAQGEQEPRPHCWKLLAGGGAQIQQWSWISKQ